MKSNSGSSVESIPPKPWGHESMRAKPWIGIPADTKEVGLHPSQVVGDKYVNAIADAADAIPLILPSLSPGLPFESILESLDGLFLTGAYSNIEPRHYGNEPSYPGNLHDPVRDENTLGLIPTAIKLGLPVLAVCRGMQEVNVALGGSLHQKVQEVEGLSDHREPDAAPLDIRYAPAHSVTLNPTGILWPIAGSDEVQVNSLHGQGVRDLAPGLRVEATAGDGLIEAFSLEPDQGFLLAVQWHPEWKPRHYPFYLGIFQRFGQVCRERAAARGSG